MTKETKSKAPEKSVEGSPLLTPAVHDSESRNERTLVRPGLS